MRTGVLSDESIIKHCSRHRPIPMGISKSILQPTLHDTTPYSSKKLKYIKQMSRPKDFDVLATQLTRNSGAAHIDTSAGVLLKRREPWGWTFGSRLRSRHPAPGYET